MIYATGSHSAKGRSFGLSYTGDVQEDIGNIYSVIDDREITPRLVNCEYMDTRRGPRQSPIYLLTHCIPLDYTLDSTSDKWACLGLSWPLTMHCPIAKMPHNNDVPAWLLSCVANRFSVKQKNSGKLSVLQDE
ncbi:predicted protein [Sclerotinia sclerotiorum 1980 UF-70]|uniref:Uncharacterized protein n=1 Tax=Sclerotinia sclerotiorum (strain ATCC 18683 / 1980 / Ss-1) TaxID=665079 RepID=A7EAI6_SCLS1|nr:predicted protein [Sclerotinia sclerotiorum 1980 UF-70]EDN99464.1 predicted protein [Sclerotinia sclerotiorum 1980 UF-70]